MAQVARNVQNNFIAGLKTEYTALNFPENAATDCSNMTFSLIGDVSRRAGIDYETHFKMLNATFNAAVNTYKWNNVGGDGQTQIVVLQQGATLGFFLSSNTTTSTSLSGQLLSQGVNINSFLATGGTFDSTVECQFSDGNGYLFVFHPSCDPFYCTYNPSNQSITANAITVQIRDFAGIPEPGVPYNFRPNALTPEHEYNLLNQGWSIGSLGGGWTASSTTSNDTSLGAHTWTLTTPISPSSLVAVNQVVTLTVSSGEGSSVTETGIVQSFTVVGSTVTSITLSIQSTSWPGTPFIPTKPWNFSVSAGNSATINIWNQVEGNYPANSDVWWTFKNSSGLFTASSLPSIVPSVTFNAGQAPQGHFILNAFFQDRSSASGVSSRQSISTQARPKTGCWFQGRVFYAGVDASQVAANDAPYYTWTENIYFSQIVQGTADFGICYQTNDPTAENFFDLLPTDGGVIVIQGSGSIYKLFPVQNGLLVFAANGIWFITGSTGIGFSANDYTITKISGVRSISGTSFVNVLGWPYFWNVEGIYTVEPTKGGGGGLEVNNLVVGNILSFYDNIPHISKLYARGAYDPISFQIKWCYRTTPEIDISNRYLFDGVLVHNTVEIRPQVGKAFYPYLIGSGTSTVNGITFPSISAILYIENPSGGVNVPDPIFKYLVTSSQGLTFSEESNTLTYTDWLAFDGTGVDAAAFLRTGYNLKPQHHPYYGYFSQALVKHSVSYINVFIRNTADNGFIFNSVWDWASSSDTGKFSSEQQITNSLTSNKFQYVNRRLRVRGRGYALQLQFKSQVGKPMDIVGWSVFESIQEAP